MNERQSERERVRGGGVEIKKGGGRYGDGKGEGRQWRGGLGREGVVTGVRGGIGSRSPGRWSDRCSPAAAAAPRRGAATLSARRVCLADTDTLCACAAYIYLPSGVSVHWYFSFPA